MSIPFPTPAQVGSSDMKPVTWVSAKTKTRSKKSSSVVTGCSASSSPSTSGSISRGCACSIPWMIAARATGRAAARARPGRSDRRRGPAPRGSPCRPRRRARRRARRRSRARPGARAAPRELVVDLEPLLVRRLPEEQVVEPVDPLQLLDRLGMVVDAEVDGDVARAAVAAVLADDEEGGRLPAAPVAARRPRRRRGRRGAARRAVPRRGFEGRGQRLDRRRRDEDVPLRGVARPGRPAGPLEAVRARVGRPAPVRVDDADLAVRRPSSAPTSARTTSSAE